MCFVIEVYLGGSCHQGSKQMDHSEWISRLMTIDSSSLSQFCAFCKALKSAILKWGLLGNNNCILASKYKVKNLFKQVQLQSVNSEIKNQAKIYINLWTPSRYLGRIRQSQGVQ